MKQAHSTPPHPTPPPPQPPHSEHTHHLNHILEIYTKSLTSLVGQSSLLFFFCSTAVEELRWGGGFQEGAGGQSLQPAGGLSDHIVKHVHGLHDVFILRVRFQRTEGKIKVKQLRLGRRRTDEDVMRR